MSEQRSFRRSLGSFLSRRRRWVTGGISMVCISGLIVSGLASPASAADLPNNVTLRQWADFAGGWVAGELGDNGAGASRYEEGQTVPFRLDVTDAGAGTFEFSVCRDYDNGSARGYLSLEPYTTSRTPSLGSLLVTDAAEGSAQPFTGAALVGSVTINSVNEVGGPGSCGAGQRETHVHITIADGPLGADPEGAHVLWGGRLASPADAEVGPANGASRFPGGSLSMRLGGSAKNVGIKPSAIIQLGTITVQKVVDSGTAAADRFCFNIAPNPNGVTLPLCPVLDAGSTTSATASFLALPTASYTVTEVGLNGYAFASGGGTANCSFLSGVATASVTAANTPTNATCVFHNRRQTGTLTINQVIDPADDPGRFNLQIDGVTAGTGADVGHGGTTGAITVSSGGHGVGQTAGTDTDLADYSSTVSCTAGGTPVSVADGQVAVADGQDVVCTITLTREPLIIIDPTTTTTTSGSQDDEEDDEDSSTTTTPTVDPSTDEDDDPGRCASSRAKPRTDECDGDDNLIVDPVVDTGDPTTGTPDVDPGTTVAGKGEEPRPAPAEQVLGGELDRSAPAPVVDPAPAGGTLPRTGAGIGTEVTLAVGLLAAGLSILRVSRRRTAATKG